MNHPREDAQHREQILRRRAERLAGDGHEEARRDVAVQAALVSVGAQRIAIPAEDLREIVPLPDVTALPALPPWLLGIAEVRGELLGVIDLATIAGMRGQRAAMMAIVDGSRGPLGLAVEAVLGFRDIHVDELSTELGEGAQGPFRAITRDLVAVLDARRLPGEPGERA
ncbi:MAG: chemotaxis protein CheW [Polyangiaceae bacterium]|nr:chemotaxis protein CheW [Polyangiaceae bacterium]